jgi:hypothetical protein
MGEAAQQEKEAEHLCHRYIAEKVSGVFFARWNTHRKKTLSIDASSPRWIVRGFKLYCSTGAMRHIPCAQSMISLELTIGEQAS